jgi:crotonobetainyl-CoA:carnitine CoA-transferase CaiB-like acyl-CoA transferase
MSRIVDLTAHSAAYATRMLAEAGHDVIRVEPPEGDTLRRLEPYLGNKSGLENGAYHQFLNAGKRSLVLNLDHIAGKRLLVELAGKVDVVVANNPLPYASEITNAAERGLVLVRVDDNAPELCAVARSGLLSLTGQPDRPPVVLGGHVVYAVSGLYTAVATALALWQRQLTGRGQSVAVSVKQCLESLVEQAMVEYTFTGKGTERRGGRGTITATSGALRCKDGYWMISLVHSAEGWNKLMEWMDDPLLKADPSLTEEENRGKKRDLILNRIESWAERFTKAELVVEAQKRHIAASPVCTVLDLIEDPQLIARGFLTQLDHPQFGHIIWPVGAIASLRKTGLSPAPKLGQHNGEILAELGYSPAEQHKLVQGGALNA